MTSRSPSGGLHTRRAILGGTLAVSLAPIVGSWPRARADEAPPSRIVALDWGIAATLIALGVPPIGTPAPRWYRRIVVAPALPPDIVDVGLLFTPNFELLLQLAPGLILAGPGLTPAAPFLERIAPLSVVSIFEPSRQSYARAETGTRDLAKVIAQPVRGERLIAETAARLAEIGKSLEPVKQRDFIVASLIDDRHISVFGGASLYQDVLARLGLINAGERLAPESEFSMLGIEALLHEPDASLILIDTPAQTGIPPDLLSTPLWRALPFTRQGRIHRIGSVLSSGGLPSARRFAELTASALLGGKDAA